MFVNLIEKGVKLKVLSLCDRIIFVSVALGAPHSHAEPQTADRIGSIDRLLHPILLLIRSSFRIVQSVPVKPRCCKDVTCCLR